MAYIAEYNFDESSGSIVTDYSGLNNHLDLTGSSLVRSPTGHDGKGLTQSGSTVASLPNIGITNDRTFMCWVKNIEDIGTGWVFEQHIPSPTDSGAWGLLVLSGQVHVQVRNSSSVVRASAALPSAGTYHHYAGRYNNATGVVDLFIDGALSATNTLAGPINTGTTPPVIGEYSATTTIIDNFRLASHVANDAEIASKMSSPVGSGGGSIVMAQSIADKARTNMLSNRGLSEPQRISNADLMALVLADNLQTLVTKTSASVGTHLLRYEMSLR